MRVDLERLSLKAPFRISGYTFTTVPVVVATLSAENGAGRGEAAGVYYLDDTPQRIAETLESRRDEIERGLDRQTLRELLPIGGARNALDCALWELESKRTGAPVWRLVGLDHASPRLTTFTLSADDPGSVAYAARALSNARALKLKLSGDVDADTARVLAARAARPDVWLAVDANQGYTLDTFDAVLPALIDARVELVEQPLPRGCEADLERLKCSIPIAADESVQGLSDVETLVGRFQIVNIKLDKCGGLTEALEIVNEARRLGLQVMVGNMMGTSLAMAPAYVLAQLCDYVDLDGPLYLAADRTPSVRYDGGSIHCADAVWGAAANGAGAEHVRHARPVQPQVDPRGYKS